LDFDAIAESRREEEKLHKYEHSYSSLFEGCRLFLSLSDPITCYQVQRICQESGAVLLETLSLEATHVISDLNDEDINRRAKLLHVKLMLQSWIMESFKAKELQAEHNYEIEL
jgi:hypothetical protein